MLAYLFLSKVASPTQSNSLSAIFFPYVHLCLTTGQEHCGIAVFACLRRLNIITSLQYFIPSLLVISCSLEHKGNDSRKSHG